MFRRREQAPDYVQSPIILGEQTLYLYDNSYYSGPVIRKRDLGKDYVIVKSDVCFDETHPGPPYHAGGPLDIRHHYTDQYVVHERDSRHRYGPFYYKYSGGFIPQSFSTSYLDWTDTSSSLLNDCAWVDPDIVVDGTTGWNKAKPSAAQVESLVALGELDEIPRMLKNTAKFYYDAWKAASKSERRLFYQLPGSAADNFLNIQFGWLPFLRDLQDLRKTVANQEKYIDQLRRDNRQWRYVRRSVRENHSKEVVYDDQSNVGHMPVLSTHYYTGPPWGSRTVVLEDKLKVWLAGRFRYYIPQLKVSGPTTMWEAAYLYGLMPSPAVIYELTPWSWLADWVANAGDIVDNLSSILLEGVTSKYAYVMAHRKQTATCRAISNFSTQCGGPLETVSVAMSEQKVRRAASPFGFGLKPSEFSPRKWAILGALGLSKATIKARTYL